MSGLVCVRGGKYKEGVRTEREIGRQTEKRETQRETEREGERMIKEVKF